MITASDIEGEEEEEKVNRSTVVFNTPRTSGSGTVVNVNGDYNVKFNIMPGGAPPEAMNQIFKHIQAASRTPYLSVAQLPRRSEPPSDQITTMHVAVDTFCNSAIRSVDQVRVMVDIVQTMLVNPMLCSSQNLPETLASLKRMLTLMELALQAYRHTDLVRSLSSAISIGVEECHLLLDELISNLTNYRQFLSDAVLYFIGNLRKSHRSFAACLLALGRAAWPELKRGMGKETLDELAKFYVELERESTLLRHIKVDTVIVTDHLGRTLPVPMVFCTTSQDFHVVITGFCSGLAGDVLIQRGNYMILDSENDQVIDPEEFAIVLQPGIDVTMSIVFHEQAEERQGSQGHSCPRCQHINNRCIGWVTCGNCAGQFKISPDEESIVSPETQEHAGTDFVPGEMSLFRKISILQAASFNVQKQSDPTISADKQPASELTRSPASSFVQTQSDPTISADEQSASGLIRSPASSFMQKQSDPTILADEQPGNDGLSQKKVRSKGGFFKKARSVADTQSSSPNVAFIGSMDDKELDTVFTESINTDSGDRTPNSQTDQRAGHANSLVDNYTLTSMAPLERSAGGVGQTTKSPISESVSKHADAAADAYVIAEVPKNAPVGTFKHHIRRPTSLTSIQLAGSSATELKPGDSMSAENGSRSGGHVSLTRGLGDRIGDNVANMWRRKAPKADSRNESVSNRFMGKAKVPERSNIIFFGESGSGKSSLINMIDGHSRAEVSNSSMGVTFSNDPYDVDLPGGQLITIWDTAGLDESPRGRTSAETAIGNLYKLTRSLDSIHLLVYCVRQRVTDNTFKNYKILNLFCDGQVPIAVIVTGLELDPNIEDWWPSHRDEFERGGIKADAHACVAAIKICGREAEYEGWTKTVQDVIVKCQRRLENPWIMERDGWFEISFGGQRRKLRDEFVKLGLTLQEAEKFAKKCIR